MINNLPLSHITVGMSGGVDSSVAAFLLKKAGHKVEGIFMKNWEGDDTAEYCPAQQDLADAEAVCDLLDIPFSVVNFADQYWQTVFSHFLDEYRVGHTPNPDILCNKEIKFKAFLDYAKQRGANYIATGHYVRSANDANRTLLLKGNDHNKDQSYFLHALTEKQISQSLFPVGHLTKPQVREIAKEYQFNNHSKKDSTGICFIGERRFKTFLNEYLPAQPGLIKTVAGEDIGEHDGLMFYTIGQRQGLQIGGKKNKSPAPWYVIEKDLKNNILYVVQGDQHPGLFKKTLYTGPIHWINHPPTLPLQAMAKTRYRQADQPCLVTKLNDNCHEVIFEQPQRAITPGQSLVLYQDEVCLGGGIIKDDRSMSNEH